MAALHLHSDRVEGNPPTQGTESAASWFCNEPASPDDYQQFLLAAHGDIQAVVEAEMAKTKLGFPLVVPVLPLFL
jgi:hypothetical protein